MAKPRIMWAVFNYDLMWGDVYHRRRVAIDEGAKAMGSRKKFDRCRKRGEFRLAKVTVLEVTK